MLTHKMCSLTIFAYGQSNKILWSTTMKNKNQREKEREKKFAENENVKINNEISS